MRIASAVFVCLLVACSPAALPPLPDVPDAQTDAPDSGDDALDADLAPDVLTPPDLPTSPDAPARDDVAPAPDLGDDVSDDISDDISDDAALDAAPADVAKDVPDVMVVTDAGARCASEAECAPAGLHCHRPSMTCVECVTDTQCGADRVCNSGRCVARVPCTSSRMCPMQVCDFTLGHCVDCAADRDCPDGAVCVASACVAPPRTCSTRADCADLGQVCDPTRRQCVDCAADADCPSGNFCGTDATCRPQACAPDATECLDPATLRSCDARGAQWSTAPCPSNTTCLGGRCMTRVCTPGARDCADANTRRECSADGLGYTGTTCASGETCLGGGCVPRTCAPGSATCADTSLRRVCNSDGLGYSLSPCAPGQGCADGACAPYVCSPNSASCVSTITRRTCSANGLSSTDTPCAAMQTCSGGACLAWRCTPGAVTCNGASRSVCNSDGLGSTDTPCGAMQTCSGGACVALMCSPGTYFCDAMGARQRCASDGQSATASPCASSEACYAGTCRPRGDACPGLDLTLDGPAVTVTPTGLATSSDVGTSCGSGGPRAGWTDVVLRFTLATARDVTLSVNSGVSTMRVQLQRSCIAGSPPVGACATGGTLNRRYAALDPGEYFVVVEFSGAASPFIIGATTAPPNTRVPGDACPGVEVPPDTSGATITPTAFEPAADVGTTCGSRGGTGSWVDWVGHFRLASPRDVTVSATVVGSNATAYFEVRTACSSAAPSLLRCLTGNTPSRRYRNLPAGDYYIVGERTSAPTSVAMQVVTSDPTQRLLGDACVTAAEVTPDGDASALPSAGYDNSPDIGTSCGSGGARADGWYDWVWHFRLTSQRDVRLDFTGLPTSARMQVMTACGDGSPTAGECLSPTTTYPRWMRGLAAGDYYVVVESTSTLGSTGASLRVSTAATGSAASGDTCATAADVTVDGSPNTLVTTGFDVGAATGSVCASASAHATNIDAVWHFRLDATRDVTLALSGAPSATYWQLQRGCGDALPVAGCASTLASRRYRDLPPGDYYVVAEWGRPSSGGYTVALTATSTAPTTRATGDVCGTVVPVTFGGGAASALLESLTAGGEFSTACGSGTGVTTSYRDAVFAYTVPSRQDVAVRVDHSSSIRTYFEVWSTCGDPTSSTGVCRTSSSTGGTLTLFGQAPGTYYVVVQSTSTTGPVAVTVGPATSPPSPTAGYTASSATGLIDWVDACAAPGRTTYFSLIDDGTASITTPFAFPFWGAVLPAGTAVNLSSNGFMNLDGAVNTSRSGNIPSTTAPNSLIAAQWRDLIMGVHGACVATVGAAPRRRWVVAWPGARVYSNSGIGPTVNAEAIIHEGTGLIEMVYLTTTNSGTIGVENATGSAGATSASGGVLNNTAVRFTPNG